MPTNDTRESPLPQVYASVLPDLRELCRIHDVSIDLIERSHDLDELLDRVLDEYERRLSNLDNSTIERPENEGEARKLRALIMFASQAAALKEKAVAATELRLRALELERANANVQRALAQEERLRERLDDVLAALDAGILVVAAGGKIEAANSAACRITGASRESVVGRPVDPFLGEVVRNSNGEVTLHRDDNTTVVVISRRNLPSEPQAEVVLLSDVTERDQAMRARHHLEHVRELFKTLAVLSHKINNPLTSLMGRAQILKLKQGLDPEVIKAADVIEESSARIASYIRDLAKVVREGREEALKELLRMDLAAGAEEHEVEAS